MDSVKKSFGEFIGGLLSTMDYSAYVPAAVLTAWVWLMTRIAEADSTREALSSLADTSLGAAAVFVIVVFVVAALINPFQFWVIQFLEGYGNVSLRSLGYLLETRRFDRIERRLNRLALKEDFFLNQLEDHGGNKRAKHKRSELFVSSWQGFRVELKTYRSEKTRLFGLSKPEDMRLRRWAEKRREIEARASRRKLANASRKHKHAQYAKDHLPLSRAGLLPTRLGNRLSSHEHRADEAAQGNIDEIVPSIHHKLPNELKKWHDQARSQFEMQCTLVATLAIGALSSAFLLDNAPYRVGFCLLALTLSRSAYGGALLSSDNYGLALSVVGDAQLTDDPETTGSSTTDQRIASIPA